MAQKGGSGATSLKDAVRPVRAGEPMVVERTAERYLIAMIKHVHLPIACMPKDFAVNAFSVIWTRLSFIEDLKRSYYASHQELPGHAMGAVL